jgi:hypothetical protein
MREEKRHEEECGSASWSYCRMEMEQVQAQRRFKIGSGGSYNVDVINL